MWQFTLKFDVGHQGKEPFRNVFYNRITFDLVDPTGIQPNISEMIIFRYSLNQVVMCIDLLKKGEREKQPLLPFFLHRHMNYKLETKNYQRSIFYFLPKLLNTKTSLTMNRLIKLFFYLF